MEIRQLNTFLQLAAVLNFTQAGRNLGYSQPNISMQIQQLEQEIGAPLFNRMGRQISLTQYGEQLLPYAQQIVSTATKMENFLKSEEALGGTLRFGVVDSMFGKIQDRLLLSYHKLFPKVLVDVVSASSAVLLERLEHGLLDVACLIDSPVSKVKWNCWHMAEIPIGIIASQNNPLAQRDSLTLADLGNEKFILMEDTVAYSALFQTEMASRGIPLRTAIKMPNAILACRLVAASSFLSVLPQYNVSRSRQRENLRILNVTDYAQMQYVQVLLHPNKVLIPQIEGFLDLLCSIIDDVTVIDNIIP